MSNESSEHGGGNLFLFPVVTLIIGLILDEVNKQVSFLGIPDSVVQFLFAMISSFMMNKFLPSEISKMIDENFSWRSVEPQVILMVILPPLIFESSFKINSNMFFAKLKLIGTLTIFVYFVTFLLSAVVILPLLISTQMCSFSSVFMFICIIVATDPVAVVAILEQNNAPHRLRILIEGESLLNDGLALTAYRVLVDVMKFESDRKFEIDYQQQCIGLFMCLIVSPLVGSFGAYVVAWVASKLHENKKRQALIVVSVFGMFILCDKIKGSSALGLVFFGVTLNYYKELMTPITYKMALELWQALGYWANNVIFLFAGYTVGREMFRTPQSVSLTTYMPIVHFDINTLIQGVVLSPIPLLARITSIYMFYKLYSMISSKKLPPKSDFVILSYAGLRGALGLILALELTKTNGLEGSEDTKMILLLTCSSTFTCLVFQGLSFAAVATKEGSTRRSKYVKDFSTRLSNLVEKRARTLMQTLEDDRDSYLLGANWKIIQYHLKDTLRSHSNKIANEMSKSSTEQSDPWENEDAMTVSMKETTEAKIGIYGVLLARTRDAWARGAVSGGTVHVIAALLEHGIDEGSIDAADIEDHLERIELSRPSYYLSNFANWLYNMSCNSTCINRFAEMGRHELFGNGQPSYVIPRNLEKWWVLHTTMLSVYWVLTVRAVFNPDLLAFCAALHCCVWVFALITLIESIYICYYEQKRCKSGSSAENRAPQAFYSMSGEEFVQAMTTNETRRCRRKSKEYIPAILSSILMFVAMFISVYMLNKGECIQNSYSPCVTLRFVHLGCITLCVMYRLLRATPVAIVLLYEHCLHRKFSRDRIRLAVFHYLHHLMKVTKVSEENYSKEAYKVVKKEIKRITNLVDGLMRLDFKEHVEEIDVVPVIKTRQGLRMMSYLIEQKLEELRTEGFLPVEAEEGWNDACDSLREQAESILTVPQIDFEPLLRKARWLQKLKSSSRDAVVKLVAKSMRSKPIVPYQPKNDVQTGGTKMWFIKKGICKVVEWLPNNKIHPLFEWVTIQLKPIQLARVVEWLPNNKIHPHEFYLGQGDLIGERNLLLIGSKIAQMPLMFPHRRYETKTVCEMIEIDDVTMAAILKTDKEIYREVSIMVQSDRLIVELRHLYPNKEITQESFWGGFNSKNGTLIEKFQRFDIPEGRIAILGCWTNITNISAANQVRQNRTSIHIHGPATIWVEPADVRAKIGMMYMEKLTNMSPAATAIGEDKSAISLVHDASNHVQEEGSASTTQVLPPTPLSKNAEISGLDLDTTALTTRLSTAKDVSTTMHLH